MGIAVLLDTHSLLWALMSPDKLSARARGLLTDLETDVLVSAACAWEIATKSRLGKLPEALDVVANYSHHLETLRAKELPITSSHALLAGNFDAVHRDPFDRVIAAQSTLVGIPVITKDPAFALFPCRTIW